MHRLVWSNFGDGIVRLERWAREGRVRISAGQSRVASGRMDLLKGNPD